MKLDLDDLERKAREAGAHRWQWGRKDGTNSRALYSHGCGDRALPILQLDAESLYLTLAANTEHIAAASPPVVLALIARIRELEGALREAARGIGLSEPHTEAEARADAELSDRCLELLDKGAVLP